MFVNYVCASFFLGFEGGKVNEIVLVPDHCFFIIYFLTGLLQE